VNKATTLPLHFPVRSSSGAELSAIAIPENTIILISILAANRNRAIWGDDANEWKPERWFSSTARKDGQGTDVTFDGVQAGSSVPALGVKDGVRYPGVYSNMSVLTRQAIVFTDHTQDDLPWRQSLLHVSQIQSCSSMH
jgi:hypothetical protein